MIKFSPRIVRRIESVLNEDETGGMVLLKRALALFYLGYAGAVRTRALLYKNGSLGMFS